LIARFGGDEFAVLLPGIDLDQAKRTAERVREQVVRLSPISFSTAITVSIGVTGRTGDDDVSALVQRADQAMYTAKANGRNCVAVSPSR
jgi:diguanylate cyclase (GGDEF)-like protein